MIFLIIDPNISKSFLQCIAYPNVESDNFDYLQMVLTRAIYLSIWNHIFNMIIEMIEYRRLLQSSHYDSFRKESML